MIIVLMLFLFIVVNCIILVFVGMVVWEYGVLWMLFSVVYLECKVIVVGWCRFVILWFNCFFVVCCGFCDV